MTKAADIKIGQRVRATNLATKNTAEFTVRNTVSGAVYSQEHSFPEAAWSFEVVETPIPEKPGLYTMGPGYKFALRTTYDGWFWIDFTSEDMDARPIENLQEWAHRFELVYQYVPKADR